MSPPPRLGVVIVTFNAADVILPCLESLLAGGEARLSVAVVDNASTDGTPALLRAWARGDAPAAGLDSLPFPLAAGRKPLPLGTAPAPQPAGHDLCLIETGVNGGFAAGVNAGLAALAARAELDRFWILNPDSVVAPGTAGAFAAAPGGFGLLGGRLVYLEDPSRIQIDGGRIDRRTGVTRNANQLAPAEGTPPPDPAGLDFVTGASMVVSRAFLETAGPMPEDYFLYYEEVDWALRRGALPIAWVGGAVVYHRAGSAIGSGTPSRRATPFSQYFKHRGRLRFVRRHRRAALPGALAFSLAKAGQALIGGDAAGARAILAGSFDLPPPAEVRARLGPAAAARAFAPWRRRG